MIDLSFFDSYNGYFEVCFQLQKIADGAGYAAADRITIINGAHSLIKHLMIKSAGKIVYDTDNLHNVTFVKNLLEYSDDFSRSVGKNSLWYLDTNNTKANNNTGFESRRLLSQAVNNDGTGGERHINVIIPLNRYSFFEELESKMLVPMQIQFNINLNEDGELIHMANGTDAGRNVIHKFELWLPKLIPKDSVYSNFVSSFMKESKWKYLRELYEVSQPTQTSGYFQISASIDNVKYVFVYLKKSYRNANGFRHEETTPYKIDTFSLDGGATLNNCRLEYGNGVFYPELEYDSDSKVRIFNGLMSFDAMRKNDYNSGTQLNLSNYDSLYPLLFFHLSFQTEKVTRDPK